jgi:CHAD domain-containing protein
VTYRLKPNRPLSRELRRIVDKQLACAIDGLHGLGDPRSDAAVHEARRHIKKTHAAIRLVREPLGAAYGPFNERMREAHRVLGPITDGGAAVATIKRLRNRLNSEPDDHALAVLQAALVQRLRRVERKAEVDRVLPAVVDILRTERAHVAGWRLNGNGVGAMTPGLHRTVRRARKAMGRALKHPTAAHYHAWRQRVKELWYQLRLLNRSCGDKLTMDVRRLHTLEGWLGEHHNVMLVENIIVTEALLPRETSARCLRLLRRYQRQIQRRAATLGARALGEKPHQVVERVEAFWRAARERRARERHHAWRRAA